MGGLVDVIAPYPTHAELTRNPFLRAGSVKRLASAVGEGAQVIATIHGFLARIGERVAVPVDQGRV